MIRVKAPDGSFVNFPEGTAPSVMEGAMQQKFGGPTTAPATAPDVPFDIRTAPKRDFGADVTALAAGTGKGIGNIALGAETLAGRGLKYLGMNSAGDYLVQDAKTGQIRLAKELAPYEAKAPGMTGAGQFTGEVLATLPIGGALAAPFRAAKVTAPIATALETGGFRTGLIPTRAAIASGNAIAPTFGTRAADLALRTGAGAATGATVAAVTNPDDVATGTIFGALIPTAGAKTAKVIGNGLKDAYDFLKGTTGAARAAELFRSAIGVNLQDVIKLLQNAPKDATLRQVLQDANIDADAVMALGEIVEKGPGAPRFGRIAEEQKADQVNALAGAAGGATAAEARTAAEKARVDLNAMNRPAREAALARANVGGQQIPPLAAEAASQRALAAQRTAEARNLGPLAARTANDRQILGGVLPLEQPDVPQEFLNRTGVMAGLAEQGLNRAAQGSLEAGAAARTAESKIAELQAQGLEILNHNPIVGTLDTLAKKVGDRANPIRKNILTSLGQQLRDLVEVNGGVLDARDLYEFRKTAVNDTIARLLNDSNVVGEVAKERTATLLGEIKPLIDQAIENAGGKGWKKYLETYAAGAKDIERQQMAARALDIYRADPTKYVELLKGVKESDLNAVEEVFGPGSFDFVKEMTPGKGAFSRLPSMQEVARQVTRDTKIDAAAARGADAAKQLLLREGNLGAKTIRVLSRLVSGKGAYTGELINALAEQRIAPQIQTALVKGFESGKSALELIAQLSSKDRAAAARAMSNPLFWSAVTTRGVAEAVRPINAMAPPAPDNRNALAR
jgi:hypothetical protein